MTLSICHIGNVPTIRTWSWDLRKYVGWNWMTNFITLFHIMSKYPLYIHFRTMPYWLAFSFYAWTLNILSWCLGSIYYWLWLDYFWRATIWFCECSCPNSSFTYHLDVILLLIERVFFWLQWNVIGQLLGFLGSGLYAFYKLIGR